LLLYLFAPGLESVNSPKRNTVDVVMNTTLALRPIEKLLSLDTRSKLLTNVLPEMPLLLSMKPEESNGKPNVTNVELPMKNVSKLRNKLLLSKEKNMKLLPRLDMKKLLLVLQPIEKPPRKRDSNGKLIMKHVERPTLSVLKLRELLLRSKELKILLLLKLAEKKSMPELLLIEKLPFKQHRKEERNKKHLLPNLELNSMLVQKNKRLLMKNVEKRKLPSMLRNVKRTMLSYVSSRCNFLLSSVSKNSRTPS